MPTLRRALLPALLMLLTLAPGATQAKTKAKAKPDLTIVSRNLYLGADIIKLVGAKDEAAQEGQVKTLFDTVKKTNFPLRAKAIAKEIKATQPDLIGLQEVARYYRGAAGVHDNKVDAKTVIYDWLALLQKQLKARGLHYRVVSEQSEINVEVASAAGYDLRLKLGNAVLVKTGKGARVKVTKKLSGIFKHQLSVPLVGETVHLHRGYAGMTGTVAGKKFIFLDPHAEAYSAADAKGQLQELLKVAAKSRTTPTIIAGDLNSDPADKEPNAYKVFTKAGFVDTQAKRLKTCCQNETVSNTVSQLKTWIDHIVVRPRATVLKTWIFGNKRSDRIGGLWPSDHAGVAAKIRLK